MRQGEDDRVAQTYKVSLPQEDDTSYLRLRGRENQLREYIHNSGVKRSMWWTGCTEQTICCCALAKRTGDGLGPEQKMAAFLQSSLGFQTTTLVSAQVRKTELVISVLGHPSFQHRVLPCPRCDRHANSPGTENEFPWFDAPPFCWTCSARRVVNRRRGWRVHSEHTFT